MKNTFLFAGLMLILLISSCDKIEKKTMTSTEAQTLLTESVTAYSIFASTQEEGTRTGFDAENILKSAVVSSSEYPTVTIEPYNLTTWPKTITVDYGPENVTGWDGVKRRGVMVIEASNFPSVANATWELTFDEFYHNDYKVEGTQTITYKGKNASEHPVYTCKIKDGRITSPEKKEFIFEQNTTREWIAGYTTFADLCDDEYLISGTHSGVSSDGYNYNMTTPEALHIQLCCQWIMEGRLAVNLPDNLLSCEINYRPGSETGELCNNQATFTIFGEDVPITLP